MRLALYQLEIAQNVGTLMRLGACLNIPLDIIEPLGFPWNDVKMRRAGMDYIDLSNVTRYSSFDEFWRQKQARVVLLDVKASCSFLEFQYQPDDIIMVGQESSGVPDSIFEQCETVKIPMVKGTRSLNVAISAAIGVSEALRQTKLFP